MQIEKYTTLTQIKSALAQPGAMLVFNERIMVQSYFVEVEGRRTRCSKTADRLTYGKNKFVTFSHRTPLERFYVVTGDDNADAAANRGPSFFDK